jgi:hypothetical protein
VLPTCSLAAVVFIAKQRLAMARFHHDNIIDSGLSSPWRFQLYSARYLREQPDEKLKVCSRLVVPGNSGLEPEASITIGYWQARLVGLNNFH